MFTLLKCAKQKKVSPELGRNSFRFSSSAHEKFNKNITCELFHIIKCIYAYRAALRRPNIRKMTILCLLPFYSFVACISFKFLLVLFLRSFIFVLQRRSH